MKVQVTYTGKTKSLTLKEGSSAQDLLEEMGINPEIVLVKQNNEIVPETELLSDKDKIDLILIKRIV
ncbi:MAG: MoaD/ThiS family protein [Candidatus Aenigmarchaeota archaeon]|nr:MoaD/ThiS family protein [Candidatus Aenigmarchaeota archaeon]